MIHDDSFWLSLKHAQNETFVFYMSTPHYGLLCEKLVELGFAATTPLLVIEQGTTDFQREYASTIGRFTQDWDSAEFGSPCTMIVGDVARWAKQNQWKEPPKKKGSYFPALPKRRKKQEKEKLCA